MELRHLRYFCAVAEEQSFTAAARRLHVSQSGVSGQIRDLEEEIGATLLRRNRRDVSLTPEGALFLREAQAILARADCAVQMVTRASHGQYGTLSIGLCGPATMPFLPRMIRAFREIQPAVMLTLKDFEPVQQPVALREEKIDIGFTRGIPLEFRKELKSELFFHEPFVVALPKGHAREKEETLQLSQLASENFVLNERESAPEIFDAIVSMCRRARFSPRILDSPKQWQSVLTMVEAGVGIALLPASVQYLRSDNVSFRKLTDRKSQAAVLVAWRRDDPDVIRDGFLTILRRDRLQIARAMQQL